MAAISAFRVTQHSQIFSLFYRNRIQCIALYKLHNSQALLNLRRGYYSTQIESSWTVITIETSDGTFSALVSSVDLDPITYGGVAFWPGPPDYRQ